MFIFLLWGFRNKVETMATLQLACRNGHTAAHRLVRVSRKFTLFWIPLFTVKRSYHTTCAQCGIAVAWTAEDAGRVAAQAGTGMDPTTGSSPDGGTIDPVSAPVLPTASQVPGPPAGWYPDPAGGAGLRWWDGRGWTDDVRATTPPA